MAFWSFLFRYQADYVDRLSNSEVDLGDSWSAVLSTSSVYWIALHEGSSAQRGLALPLQQRPSKRTQLNLPLLSASRLV